MLLLELDWLGAARPKLSLTDKAEQDAGGLFSLGSTSVAAFSVVFGVSQWVVTKSLSIYSDFPAHWDIVFQNTSSSEYLHLALRPKNLRGSQI